MARVRDGGATLRTARTRSRSRPTLGPQRGCARSARRIVRRTRSVARVADYPSVDASHFSVEPRVVIDHRARVDMPIVLQDRLAIYALLTRTEERSLDLLS